MPRNKLLALAAAIFLLLLVCLAYSNVVFWGRSLNPVLLIPDRNDEFHEVKDSDKPFPDETRLTTGYRDIRGAPGGGHNWHVDLANPAYLEWPVNIFVGKSLRAGYIPLVLPTQCLGVPLIGQYCHRVLSPYQMVENLFLPDGYDFFVILRLILAGWFAFLFLNPMCRRRTAALLGGIGYGLGGIMVIFSNHEEISNVAMLLPLLMWTLRAYFDRPGWNRAAGLALALALVHTAGQPEIQLYVLFLALLYGGTRLTDLAKGSRARAGGIALGAILVSALIAAPQLYLFLQFHGEAWSFHPPGGNMGIQSPMLIRKFLFSFLPKFRQTPWPWSYRTINLLWDWVGGYFGTGLLFLAAANLGGGRRHRKEKILFGLYFLFILAKNLGWSPAQLIGLLPFFDQAWSPRWAAATWSFALACLAALGLDNLLHPSRAGRLKPGYQRRGGWRPGTPLTLLLFLAVLTLAGWARSQAAAAWQGENLRAYVLSSGGLGLLAVAAAALLWNLAPSATRELIRRGAGKTGEKLRQNQAALALALVAVALAATRMFPGKHYDFSGPEPLFSYLLAAPLLLLALSGIFAIGARPANLGGTTAAALAIPIFILGAWGDVVSLLPPVAFWGVPGLILLGTLVTGTEALRTRRIWAGAAIGLLLGLFILALSTTPFKSAERNTLIRLHALFTVLLLAVYSGLSLSQKRGKNVSGWCFLFPVWAELAAYIPKNHFDRYLLLDAIPFLAAAGGAFWLARRRRRGTVNGGVIAVSLLPALAVFLADGFFPTNLPARCAPREVMPFVEYLRDRNPGGITGVGRVLAPNFASAQGLVDMRGCVSMNTASYQFFLEKILGAVPPASSYSLWHTGENPIDTAASSPYGSSRMQQREAFAQAIPFYRLAGARYVLSDLGLLDPVGQRNGKTMNRIYRRELDIWELSSLPPAYVAHQAKVVSMLEDPEAWKQVILEDRAVLDGNLVVLGEPPGGPPARGEASPLDRAKLIPEENPNLLRIRFRTPTPGYLVVNRAHTGLLRASLAGRSLPILRANGPFLAVPVPGAKDDQELLLDYFSPQARASFWLGGGVGAATLLAFLLSLRKIRRQA